MDNNIYQVVCPICESRATKRWGEKDGYRLHSCSRCCHRFAEISDEEIAKMNGDQFRKRITNGSMDSDEAYYLHLKGGEPSGSATHITASHVLRVCQITGISSGSWLDVGCGAGHLLSRAREIGYDVVGVEPGRWGQLAAIERDLRVVQGFLTTQTFSKKFNVVSATDVVEHVMDPIDFLTLLRSYMSSNGVLVFSIPFSDSFERRVLGTKWNMVSPPTHCQFFSRRSMAAALTRVGLREVLSIQFSVRPFRGIGKIGGIRSLIDKVLAGPQIVVAAKQM